MTPSPRLRCTRFAVSRMVAVAAVVIGAAALLVNSEAAASTLCNAAVYGVRWFGTDPTICVNHSPYYEDVHSCWMMQQFNCGDGGAASPVYCAGYDGNGNCSVQSECSGDCETTSSASYYCGTAIGSGEQCNNGIDDNYDGCMDEGCEKGKAPCACTAQCTTHSCSPATTATCDPYMPWAREICGNGLDDNCNGRVDEGCAPKEPNSCSTFVGRDPISIVTRSAVSEPFTDFSADAIVRLGITRTYASADASLQGGGIGIFGRGWHHDWEASLSCDGDYCTVARGIRSGFMFKRSGTAASLDGTEAWDIYARGDTETTRADGHDVLVRRPGGTWILFMTDGTEMHFATVCDSCGAPDGTCLDPRQGGTARLVDVYDAKGSRTHVSYDKPTGLLLGLADDLGHSLEVRATNACTDALAQELRFDGMTVATYRFDGVDLDRAVDADGNVLRQYYYFPGGLLRAVINESGASIVEFAYDANGDATGVIDAGSDVTLAYGNYSASGNAVVQVTERYNQVSATSTRELNEDGHVVAISGDCSLLPLTQDDGSGADLARAA